jgi:hypothetical protein
MPSSGPVFLEHRPLTVATTPIIPAGNSSFQVLIAGNLLKKENTDKYSSDVLCCFFVLIVS